MYFQESKFEHLKRVDLLYATFVPPMGSKVKTFIRNILIKLTVILLGSRL